ncbi:hypothetical protein ASNO1_17060 [Corallococcus caeni]|uniref:ATP-binding protein n=1 Tax=Corallococcus caeni TaxID=3082388 RepID=A0ABQ6QN46_9BACT|nr:hypothetical protein ASNO1_17060 [Corallococcus sp. NO1]
MFTPTPIPEAKAFRWDELLTPTQNALRDLIAWLSAACDTSPQARDTTSKARYTSPKDRYTSPKDHQDEHLSTSLLISGDRGTGKTTVLLSAAQALEDWQTFLYGSFQPEAVKPELDPLATLFQTIERRVIWLDPLDLEPLHADANLLATLLVRVRAALDLNETGSSAHGVASSSHSSILEESAEEAWGQLDRLVQDATLMWEAIKSTDDRTRADLQIKSSDTFTSFQRDFRKAMEEVSHTLSIPRFGSAGGRQVLLVLPIDNVDRSIEHLYNIVKLTRMVSSQRIWFVLAAGAHEFQLFMERSFQKELIISGQTGIGARGQEESIAIARRQAATTLRRALPPSYRIKLDTVKPDQAWWFPYKRGEKKSTDDQKPSLHELLGKLRLRAGRDSNSEQSPQGGKPQGATRGDHLEFFSALFDLRDRLDSKVARAYRESLKVQEEDAASGEMGMVETRKHGEPLPTQRGTLDEEDPVLSYAARLALSLPARTLQDLWHALYREWRRQEDDESAVGEGAISVATLMLRDAIDESDLPAWASEQLHNRIIRRNNRHKVLLDLTGQPVRNAKRTTLADVVEWPRWEEQGDGEHEPPDWTKDHSSSSVLRRQLRLRRVGDTILMLHDLESPERCVPLPPNVAGWFMLLHDVLMLLEEEEPRVVVETETETGMSSDLVVTLQEVWVERSIVEPLVQLEFPWTLPKWETYFDYMLFNLQWKAALFRAKKAFDFNGPPNLSFAESRFRLIQAAWIDNICSVAGPERGNWSWEKTVFADDTLASKGSLDVNPLEPYEQLVRRRVGDLYGEVQHKGSHYDRLWIGGRWLEDSLPLLVLPEFAPSPRLSRLLVWETGSENGSNWFALLKFWKRHFHLLTRSREFLVRDSATCSKTYKRLFNEGGRSPRSEFRKRKWLNQVSWDWFRTVDADRSMRKLDVLQLLSPKELRDLMPRPPDVRNQELAEEMEPP